MLPDKETGRLNSKGIVHCTLYLTSFDRLSAPLHVRGRATREVFLRQRALLTGYQARLSWRSESRGLQLRRDWLRSEVEQMPRLRWVGVESISSQMKFPRRHKWRLQGTQALIKVPIRPVSSFPRMSPPIRINS